MKQTWLLILPLMLTAPTAGFACPDHEHAPIKAHDLKVMELALDPNKGELEWDTKAGTVTFKPDSQRMMAHYHHYVFDAKEFIKHAGSQTPKSPMLISYKVLKQETKTWTPQGKNMPQPNNGFQTTTIKAQIVKIVALPAVKGESH